MQPAFTRFQGVINQHFETNFKMQSFTTNYKNRHPWMTKALRIQIKIKNAMHTTCFASSTKDITKFADYNKVKDLLKSSLRNAEILYYSIQFNLHKNDLAKSWNILKTINGTNSKASINTTFTINDKLVTDSKEITNGFNYKTADTDIQHCIQYITNIPHSVLTGDVNVHSTLIADVISNSDHITLNTNTPTRVPNTTLQQTSPPDITTVSNTLYNRTSGTTQHGLSSDHLPIITTINIRYDTIYRFRFRSDHHTHCQQNFYKHHTDGRQAQHTKGQDA